MDLPAAAGCRKVIRDLEAAIEQFQFCRSTDRATQTEVSEILTIKDLTSSTGYLVEIVKSLQLDFTFLKQLLQLQFEDRLKKESSRLFSILSDRIQSLEKSLYQNDDVIRKSYSQQLSDAIAVIRAMYKKYFEQEAKEKTAEKDTIFLKMASLLKRLKDKEEIIQELREEIESYEESAFQKYDTFFREPTGSLRPLEKDLWECREEVGRLTHRVADLQEELGVSIKENANLEYEIMNLKERAEKDQSSIQKLIEGREKLVTELENEKRLVEELTVKYKDEVEIRKRFGSIALKTMTAWWEKQPSLQPSMLRIPSKTTVDLLPPLEPAALPPSTKKLKKAEKLLLAKEGDRWEGATCRRVEPTSWTPRTCSRRFHGCHALCSGVCLPRHRAETAQHRGQRPDLRSQLWGWGRLRAAADSGLMVRAAAPLARPDEAAPSRETEAGRASEGSS